MKKMTLVMLVLLGASCGPKPQAQEPQPEPTSPDAAPAKPHVDVPPLSSYSWLKTANISIAPVDEKTQWEARLVDYYSGLPMFMKVLAMFTKDRNVGLKDNPAYLSDIWTRYLELVGMSAEDPPTAVSDFDASMVQWAIFEAWKKRNEFSPVDNYEDAVTGKTYEQ